MDVALSNILHCIATISMTTEEQIDCFSQINLWGIPKRNTSNQYWDCRNGHSVNTVSFVWCEDTNYHSTIQFVCVCIFAYACLYDTNILVHICCMVEWSTCGYCYRFLMYQDLLLLDIVSRSSSLQKTWCNCYIQ